MLTIDIGNILGSSISGVVICGLVWFFFLRKTPVNDIISKLLNRNATLKNDRAKINQDQIDATNAQTEELAHETTEQIVNNFHSAFSIMPGSHSGKPTTPTNP
jgi:hypothetical protein